MPPEASDPVARWQALAEEARAIADQMTDPQARLILLTVARGYERLAQRAATRKAQHDQDSQE